MQLSICFILISDEHLDCDNFAENSPPKLGNFCRKILHQIFNKMMLSHLFVSLSYDFYILCLLVDPLA